MLLFSAMCLFAFTMSISPGPVNMITLSSGVNHGFKSSMPFVSGATLGFTLLLVSVGLGLGALATEYPRAIQILGLIGSLFLAYLGYKIATAGAGDLSTDTSPRPTFAQGFMLQWLNPKAWIASMAGVTAFNLGDSVSLLTLFSTLYFLICYLSIASWALAGEKARSLLAEPRNLELFNRVVGCGLAAVAVYLLLSQL